MAVTLNHIALTHAHGLIASDKDDDTSAWSFTADDSDALLGTPPDWGAYRMWFLGLDPSADPHSKAAYSYPYGKAGKIFRSAVIAIRQRASQQDVTGIFDAAGTLIAALDKEDADGKTVSTRKWIASAFEIKTLNEAGEFEGYGSTFGNEPDSYGDIVAPGAFSASLADHAAKGTMPAMLYSHDSDKECGEWQEMKEDGRGLYCKGKLWLDGQHPDPDALKAYRGMKKAGGRMGLSIGYQTKEATRDQASGVRTIKKVDLWEVSPTVFPANQNATVVQVRSASDIDAALQACTNLSDLEAVLRDAGRFSRKVAVAFVSRIKAIAQSDSDVERLRSLAARISAVTSR